MSEGEISTLRFFRPRGGGLWALNDFQLADIERLAPEVHADLLDNEIKVDR